MAESFISYSKLVQDDGGFDKLEADVKRLEKFLEEKGKSLSGKLNVVNVKETEEIKNLSIKVKELSLAKEKLEKANQAVQKTIQASLKSKRDEQKVAQELQKTEQQSIKTKQQVHRLRVQELKEVERLAKAAKRLALQKRKENSLYHQQSARLNELRKRFKDVTLAEGRFSSESKRLGKEIRILDRKLKDVDARAGQFQRNVGNYPKVFGSATRIIGQFGAALSGAFLLRGGLRVLTDYDEGLADIAKTTGLTIEKTKLLTQELLKIDTKTSISALQELATSAGRLGIEGTENIVGFVKSADQAFVALGDDLGGTADEIATGLGKISNLFGLEGEFGIEQGILKVGSGLNELSANSKASAGAIDDFTNRMSGLSAIVELGDVQALGAFFDESGQSIEVAASTLGKLLPAIGKDINKFAKVAGLSAEEFKKIADNSPIDALKLVAKGAKSSEGGLSGLSDTMEKYGVTSARASNVLNILSNNTDRLTELQVIANDAINEGSSLTGEFGLKNETLGATYDKLVKEIQKLVLGIDETGRATGFVINLMKFLIKNLGTIFKLVKAAAIGWIAYKAALLVVNKETQTFKSFGIIKFVKGLVTSIKGLVLGTKAAAGGFETMGSAMKTIPLVGIISGIASLVSLLFDFGEEEEIASEKTDELTDSLIKQAKAFAKLRGELEFATEGEDFGKKLFEFSKNEVQDFADALEKEVGESLDRITSAANDFGIPFKEITDVEGLRKLGSQLADVTTKMNDSQQGYGALVKATLETDVLEPKLRQLETIRVEIEKRAKALEKSGGGTGGSGGEDKGGADRDRAEKQRLANLKRLEKLKNESIKNEFIRKQAQIKTQFKWEIDAVKGHSATEESIRVELKKKELRLLLKLEEEYREDQRKLITDISFLNAEIDAQSKRNTGIDLLKVESLEREISLNNDKLKQLDEIIDSGKETEQDLIDRSNIFLKIIDQEQELDSLIFGRLATTQTERDLIISTSKIRISDIEKELEKLREKLSMDASNLKLQEQINKLTLEEERAKQSIRDANFEEQQEVLLKAKLDRQTEFNDKVVQGEFEVSKRVLKLNEKLANESDPEKRLKLQKKLDKEKIKTQEETNESIKQGEIELQKELIALDIKLLEAQRDRFKKGSLEYKQFQDEISAKQKELFDLDKSDFQPAIDSFKQFTDELADIFGKVLDRLEELRKKDVDNAEKAITDQDKLVDEQRKRAEDGKANTLAFEQKQRAKKEADLIKAQKRLERIQKVQTFYASYQANLGSLQEGEGSGKALLKTLRDQAIADAIVAAFGDGGVVEDKLPNNGIFRGDSHKSKSGGIPIMVEGEEGIFSKREMGNLGKQNFYDLKAMAGSGMIGKNFFKGQSRSFSEKVTVINPNGKLEQEIKKVNHSIQNIPSNKIDMFQVVDGIIKWRDTEIKGNKTVRNHFRINKKRR